jgi:flagellar motility protein MotE (MotC chaperone)
VKLPRLFRLLPGVVLASSALLVLNGSGLLQDALAQGTPAPAAANKDYAGSDEEIATANQVNILTSLSRRRKELDAREAGIKTQADILAATEKRVDGKIAQLQALQQKITGLLQVRDDAQKAQIAALVKTYTGLGKKAGPIFAGLPDDVAVPVAQAMKPDDLAQVLGAMPADAAQKLTVKLANRLTLPVATDAPAPPAPVTPATAAPATPAAPARTASATPAPTPKN